VEVTGEVEEMVGGSGRMTELVELSEEVAGVGNVAVEIFGETEVEKVTSR
jgi:hypothetical protein